MEGNGEKVFAGGEGARNGEAVDDSVVISSLRLQGGELVGFGASGQVVAQDFDAIKIEDEGVVALAAEFETGVGFVRGEAVAEIRGVPLVSSGGRPMSSPVKPRP